MFHQIPVFPLLIIFPASGSCPSSIFHSHSILLVSMETTLATWCELTHLKRPWCWERLEAGGEGDNRGWDSWIASSTQWTWVWINSGSWWWTRRPGVLQSMGSQRVGHDWATELNWIDNSNWGGKGWSWKSFLLSEMKMNIRYNFIRSVSL